MKIELELIAYIFLELFEDAEISMEEFELNWCHQVPHWIFLTNEGISFFKGLPPFDWKGNESKLKLPCTKKLKGGK